MDQVELQTLTVALPVQTIQKAKTLAARRATSIDALIAEQVEALAERDQEYEVAKESALSRMEHGYHMGGGKLPTRDELHDR